MHVFFHDVCSFDFFDTFDSISIEHVILSRQRFALTMTDALRVIHQFGSTCCEFLMSILLWMGNSAIGDLHAYIASTLLPSQQ
jgi:hypothetical protein